MKIPKILSEQDFLTLQTYGSVVPRNANTGDIRSDFKVSSEYMVKSKKEDKPLFVRCTQDCPTNLKLIEQQHS